MGGLPLVHGNGKAMEGFELELASISSCLFTNLSSKSGGAVYLEFQQPASKVLIQASTFRGNIAQTGGALTLVGVHQADLVGSTFGENEASESGGAIFSMCESVQDCTLNLYQGNQFTNNKAQN
jgi:hypothetical protein